MLHIIIMPCPGRERERRKNIWRNVILSNFLILPNEILRSCSQTLTAHYARRNADLNFTLVTGMTNGFLFQIINSLMESTGVCLTWLDCNTPSEVNAFLWELCTCCSHAVEHFGSVHLPTHLHIPEWSLTLLLTRTWFCFDLQGTGKDSVTLQSSIHHQCHVSEMCQLWNNNPKTTNSS